MSPNYTSVTPNFIKIRTGGNKTERCGLADRENRLYCIAVIDLHTSDTQEWTLRK
jgi:hypothetical protein